MVIWVQIYGLYNLPVFSFILFRSISLTYTVMETLPKSSSLASSWKTILPLSRHEAKEEKNNYRLDQKLLVEIFLVLSQSNIGRSPKQSPESQ